jgi:predicted AlkP superfamily phosphohydrolase/phosphomutase
MRTVIIGLDAFDPLLFEKLHNEGKTPNLSKLVDVGNYAHFRVTDPPQSEVSWTSIATGLNPGAHGIYDFVHRNPRTYQVEVSLLPTKTSFLGTQFIPPHRARTIFDEAVSDGYPAASLWWPATFPARLESPVHTIPGLGTPDIFGRLGVGFFFSTSQITDNSGKKSNLALLVPISQDRYSGWIEGPTQKTLGGVKTTRLTFELHPTQLNNARLIIGERTLDLAIGEWSPIFKISIKAGFGMTIKAITRAILIKGYPEPQIYFLPLQPDPQNPPWPYATPKGFVKDLWENCGSFLTLGWPQDTTALEEGYISDMEFLELCDKIFQERERSLTHLLNSFDEGLLACVFDSLDRIQHMYWKGHRDVVESWYIKLDGMVGRVLEKLASKTAKSASHVIVLSDHGFGEFNYKVHLNRWLINHGYLITGDTADTGDLKAVVWSRSKVYALGLNSLYINLEGREGQGIVTVDQKNGLVQKLKDELLQWKGPDNQSVIEQVLTQKEAFQGPLVNYAPDLVIGYREKYRASAETGLGQFKADEIEANPEHWGGDHCFNARAVPGVLFSSQGLGNFPDPSYSDIPALALGKSIKSTGSAPPPVYSHEDTETIEKRLKDLGYL